MTADLAEEHNTATLAAERLVSHIFKYLNLRGWRGLEKWKEIIIRLYLLSYLTID